MTKSNRKKIHSRSAASPSSALSKKADRSVTSLYQAYAIAADGSRQPIDAHQILVDLGGREVEINLVAATPLVAGKLNVAAVDGLLVMGPADAGSICIAVEPFGGDRLKPS